MMTANVAFVLSPGRNYMLENEPEEKSKQNKNKLG